MNRTELSSKQVADMRWALERRERDIIERILQQPDYPPLPPCPACGAVVERVDSMVEPPHFEVYEVAILIDMKPCGHKFRAAGDFEGAS